MKADFNKIKVGDRVYTTNSDSGTYAEYTVAKPNFTFKLVENLSFEEGSAIGVPYFTVKYTLYVILLNFSSFYYLYLSFICFRRTELYLSSNYQIWFKETIFT